MQKIQSYLYPNRVILLANLAGFTVENTIVYQRTVKIYNGIDNTLEFDIQNADQKRIDLTGFSSLELNVMDSQGKELSNSPYTVVPMDQQTRKGLASVVIPAEDLADLSDQSLKFSVTGVKDGADVILYTDSRFGAVGRMDLNGSALPVIRDDRVYTEFAGEINFMGNVINHSPVIATKFYEAEATTTMDITVDYTDFIGEIYYETTTDMTISVNSFTNSAKTPIFSTVSKQTGSHTITLTDIVNYNYVRVSWVYPDVWLNGTGNTSAYGVVNKVTVSS